MLTYHPAQADQPDGFPLFQTWNIKGKWSFSAGIIETTHLGAFDKQVAPYVNRIFDQETASSGGKGGEKNSIGNILDIILPDGHVPADFEWNYHYRPGFKASLDYNSDTFKWRNGGTTRFSLFFMQDETRVSFDAPSGFGILIDPTRAFLTAKFYGLGTKIMLPLYRQQNTAGVFNIYGGGGFFAYHSVSVIKVKSAFLDLYSKINRNRIMPLLSLELSNSINDIQAPVETISTGLEFEAFETDYLWTLSASAKIRISF